jgi:hypothetical protein
MENEHGNPWWNNTEKRELREKHIPVPFFHHKFHTD